MKKILAIAGAALGVLVLAGCGSQPAPATPPTNQSSSTDQSTPATPTTTAPSATVPQADALGSPPVPTTTAPAKTSDVDNSLNQVNSDLNAIDKNAPDPNTINSANLQN